MAARLSSSMLEIHYVSEYNTFKETETSLRKRVALAFRPSWERLPVTNDIYSCCFPSLAMSRYVEDYHRFLADPCWNWKLASSTRLDMKLASIEPTEFEFWAVKDSERICRTCTLRFADCTIGGTQKIYSGFPAAVLLEGNSYRDGDLCYCFREEPDCLVVNELFYLETTSGRSGFVLYGTHKWATDKVDDWKRISNMPSRICVHSMPLPNYT